MKINTAHKTAICSISRVSDLSPVDMLYMNLGIQIVVNEMSKKEKFCRKRYTGVLRWESI